MNYEDILNQLMKGADPEVLAKNYTDELNKAIKMKKAADEEAAKKKAEIEKKRAAEEALKAERTNAANNILTLLKDYANKYYKNIDISNMTVEDLDNIFTNSITLNNSLNELDKALQAGHDPIYKFLKEFNLL